MTPLNHAWTAAGTLHLQRKVIDPATGLEVRPCNTEAAKAKVKATRALARRPRRTRNACRVDLLGTASPSQPGRGWTDAEPNTNKRLKTLADQSDEQKAPRRRPNHPRASNLLTCARRVAGPGKAESRRRPREGDGDN